MFVIALSGDQPRSGTHCARQCPKQDQQTVFPKELTVQTFKADRVGKIIW